MGEMVRFPSNGDTADGYLAVPPGGTGPGVIVIQEWWGLVPHIKDVADRFAAEGFVALAPDLYHGKSTKEPDEAGKLMMEMQFDKAARDMSGAFDFLLGHSQPKKIGVTGFCMGGAMTIALATLCPAAAASAFYGIPNAPVDYSKIDCPLIMHVAGHDDWVTEEKAKELTETLRADGKDAQYFVYPGTEHAFFNDTRAEVYKPDAAKLAWERTLDLFKTRLS